MSDRPWGEANRGRSITQNWLARQLKGFEIFPRTIRAGTATPKGYALASMADAFARYLPKGGGQTATPTQPDSFKNLDENKTATRNTDVAPSESHNKLKSLNCGLVAGESSPDGEAYESAGHDGWEAF
jgi:hypothetical protein